MTALIADLAAPFRDAGVERVVGIDALGFVTGTALALHLGVGFVPLRKNGKIPVPHRRAVARDYSAGEKVLALREDPWPPGTRVLVSDEWIETGGQARAAVELVEGAGGVIVGIVAIAFRRTARTADLWARYRCHAVWPETE